MARTKETPSRYAKRLSQIEKKVSIGEKTCKKKCRKENQCMYSRKHGEKDLPKTQMLFHERKGTKCVDLCLKKDIIVN